MGDVSQGIDIGHTVGGRIRISHVMAGGVGSA
jgi:hypothetical protein